MSKPIQDEAQSGVSGVAIGSLKTEEIESGVKIYCESCGYHQPMRIDRFHKVADGTIWGDICCNTCLLVILTITVPEEGEYEFRRIT